MGAMYGEFSKNIFPSTAQKFSRDSSEFLSLILSAFTLHRELPSSLRDWICCRGSIIAAAFCEDFYTCLFGLGISLELFEQSTDIG